VVSSSGRIVKKAGKLVQICFDIVNNYMGRKKYTFCPFLWNTIFIDKHGHVFSCCYRGPWSLGSYRRDLGTIWQRGIRLKIARWLSLHGSLHCFKSCFLSKQPETKTGKVNVADYPERIGLYYGDICNIRCKMCTGDFSSKIMLDNEILQKNIDWRGFRNIMLFGGEILCMAKAKEFYLWLTQTMRKKVNIYTNGILIDDKWAEHLVKGSDWIYISVNAATAETYKKVCGAEFQKAIDNIKRLISFKKRLGLKTEIIYNFTIIRENLHEAAEAIRFADNLGCDIMSFGCDTSGGMAVREDNALREKLKNEISCLLNNNDIKIFVRREQLVGMGLLDNP